MWVLLRGCVGFCCGGVWAFVAGVCGFCCGGVWAFVAGVCGLLLRGCVGFVEGVCGFFVFFFLVLWVYVGFSVQGFLHNTLLHRNSSSSYTKS